MYISNMIETEVTDTDYIKWSEESALRELGYEYAKKHAIKQQWYVYSTFINSDYIKYSEKLSDKKAKSLGFYLDHIEILYKLKED